MDGDNAKPRKTEKWPPILMALGIVTLVVGLVLLVVKIVTMPRMDDAEFLISAGEWVREDKPNVIWDFTEVGKGKLSTDGHLNNYDFKWSLEDGKLKIETAWLYDLSDEFNYSLDQGGKKLTIKNPDKGVEIKFEATKSEE